jgi:GNAT superfamily N-acetyltransferase
MIDITVREIEKGDHDQWQSLFADYNAFYGRVGPTALAADVVETTWLRFFDPAEPVLAIVAERDGQLVGLAHYLFHRSTTQIQLTCYLQDLYTSEQSRGMGVGRKLILAVYDHALASGSPRVYWQTHETNRTAMQLYDKVAERSGFVVYRKLF